MSYQSVRENTLGTKDHTQEVCLRTGICARVVGDHWTMNYNTGTITASKRPYDKLMIG